MIRWQDYTGREVHIADTGETFAQVRARRAEKRTVEAEEEADPHTPSGGQVRVEACPGAGAVGEAAECAAAGDHQ